MHPQLPSRVTSGHKGTFGTVCVLGGQAAAPRVMIGGPAFSATGALRSGAGLAVLAVPAPIMDAALTIAPGATGLALPVDEQGALRPSDVAALLDEHWASFDCVAVGPGWGADYPQQQILSRLLARDDMPLVVDADAINALAALPDVQADVRAPIVLTPHPGEYRRLAQHLGVEEDPVAPESRTSAAVALARRLGCVVVLKGEGTVITDGQDVKINDTGNVALATAGTGDVLTGIIAGLVAQFFALSFDSAFASAPSGDGLSLLDCATLGVWIHGRAADQWAARHGSAGLVAGDLLDHVPGVLATLRGESL